MCGTSIWHLSALPADFKTKQNQHFYIIFNYQMQRPRIDDLNSHQLENSQLNRQLLQGYDDEHEEVFPLKKLAKNFEHSLGFSDTNFSYSRSQAISEGQIEEEKPLSVGQHHSISLSCQLRKAGLIPSEGVSRFKSLLPIHLSTKLSRSYEFLLRISAETDKILSSRSLCGYKQSFQNLKLQFSSSFFMEISYSLFEALNYLQPQMYVLCEDPLKNIVVGLPQGFDELPMRKYMLRKEIYQFASRYASQQRKIGEVQEAIPFKPFTLTKTSLFFPVAAKLYRGEPKLKPEFLNKLKSDIKSKEKDYSSEKSASQGDKSPVSQDELLQVMNLLQSCYSSFRVSNMYLINLMSWFKRHHPKLAVQHYLQIIQQTGTYLIRKDVDGSIVLELKKKERGLLLAHITK